jgi:hypothetical protein
VHHLLTSLLYGRHRLPHTPRRTYLVLQRPAETGRTRELSRQGWRRTELPIDDALLGQVGIVAARVLTADDTAHHAMVHGLLADCGGLVLVTDGRSAFRSPEIDLLRAAVAWDRAIFLVVAHCDESEEWPDVVLANQASLANELPRLAFEPWYPLGSRRSGVADLRWALTSWADEERRRVGRPPVPPVAPKIRIASSAATSGWAQTLELEVGNARRSTERLAGRLLASVAAQHLAVEPAQVPAALDQALQKASTAITAKIRAASDAVLAAVWERVLAEPANETTTRRIRDALRAELALADGGERECYRALLVTTTAAAAAVTVPTPLAGLEAHALAAAEGVLPPIGLGLTTNCLSLWRGPTEGDPAQAATMRRWAQRAVTAIEVELQREITRQYEHLHRAVTELVSDGIDHDILLV